MVTICNQIHKNTDKFSYRGIKRQVKNSKNNSICNLWTRIYRYFSIFYRYSSSPAAPLMTTKGRSVQNDRHDK